MSNILSNQKQKKVKKVKPSRMICVQLPCVLFLTEQFVNGIKLLNPINLV